MISNFDNFNKNIINHLCSVFKINDEDIIKTMVPFVLDNSGMYIRFGLYDEGLGVYIDIREDSYMYKLNNIENISIEDIDIMYADDPTLLQLSTICDVSNILKDLNYIKSFSTFIIDIQIIIKES